MGRTTGVGALGGRVALGTRVAAALAVLALGLGLTTTGAGAAAPTWTSRGVPAFSDFTLRTVSCSGTGCVALASACSPGGCGGLAPMRAIFSVNDGASWKAGSFPSTVGSAGVVSCATSTFCAAIATKGPMGPQASSAIVVTNNGGKSFAVHVEPTYALPVVACAALKSCVALGTLKSSSSSLTSLGLVTTNGGASWTKVSFPAGKTLVESLACGAPTACVAFGPNPTYTGVTAWVSANVGKSWASVKLPAGATGAFQVSCTGLTCIALSSTQVLVSKNGGKSWALHALVAGTWSGASCMTASTCVLVGDTSGTPYVTAAAVSHNSGASWAIQHLPQATGSLVAASCETAFCVASGDRVTYSGPTPAYEFPYVLAY